MSIPTLTGFGDPEQDVLLAAMAAVSPPAGTTIPAAALEGAISEALRMATYNEAQTANMALGERHRETAGAAAHAQHSVITLFQRLLLDARAGGAA